MSYVHFDLKQVEKAMRDVRAEAMPRLLNGAASEEEVMGYLVQDRFFEAIVATQVEMIRLLNEDRTPEYIGMTLGVFIGNVTANTLAASADPVACWSRMQRALLKAIAALNGDDASGLQVTSAEICGTTGGRA